MAKTYTHLDVPERALIGTQLTLGMRPMAIAAGLMRACSSITREMQRNGWKTSSVHCGRATVAGGYRCVLADRRARLLAIKPRVSRKMIPGNALWHTAVDDLHQGLSPAQIARTLARMPDPVQLSYETIYTALYTMPRGHRRSSLLGLMRRRHRAKRPHRGKGGRRKPSIPDYDVDRSAPHRDPDAPHSRPLGGRSDHRPRRPLVGRHAGRAYHLVCCLGQVEQQQGRRCCRGIHQDT